MNISGINPTAPTATPSGGNSDVKALENKLKQLMNEKKKALENKDEEKAKEIEKKIQEIQRQLEQARQTERSEEKRGKSNNSNIPEEEGNTWYA
ncbi:hypothetical protein IMSAG049_01011 [Clostridiales bacterium]|nr:hypothetical protein IMSAG049_01011 [Clostridiales bacterium]